jgi:hypothetical protein
MTEPLSEEEAKLVLDAWPADIDRLPASVRATYDAWDKMNVAAINLAAGFAEFVLPRTLRKAERCRALTVGGISPVVGLATPSPADLRTIIRGDANEGPPPLPPRAMVAGRWKGKRLTPPPLHFCSQLARHRRSITGTLYLCATPTET